MVANRMTGDSRMPNPAEATAAGPAPEQGSVVAVIDIGSNSGRVVVLRRTALGHLEVIDDERAPLRLVEATERGGRLGEATMNHTLQALRDFRAVALRSGAGHVVAVATAAVREAADGDDLIQRIRTEVGLSVEVISAEEEGRYAFQGAIHGMPVDDGLLMDIGGGSMQLVSFRNRRLVRTWTLSLGALRLSTRFLESDPPLRVERRKLETHVLQALSDGGVKALSKEERLVGTGGTIRNLAKMDRRAHKYPISLLHGYTLTRARLELTANLVAEKNLGERQSIPGLNKDRADSIAGGVLTVLTAMRHLNAPELLVSGQGLRDGLAMAALGVAFPDANAARAAAVDALIARFYSWDRQSAARRKEVALRLLGAVDPDAPSETVELVGYAATVLDIGRSIDYYNRHEHTASIVTATALSGFSHRSLALLAAMIERAGDSGKGMKEYRPLLTAADEKTAAQCGAVLDLADHLERRHAAPGPVQLEIEGVPGDLLLRAPLFDGWRVNLIAAAHQAALGKLRIETSVQEEGL